MTFETTALLRIFDLTVCQCMEQNRKNTKTIMWIRVLERSRDAIIGAGTSGKCVILDRKSSALFFYCINQKFERMKNLTVLVTGNF